MHEDADRRFWIQQIEAPEDICDLGEDTEQITFDAEILILVSHSKRPITP
jgi:hypothetical protein